MDLVIACDTSNRHGAMCFEACEKTHKERIEGIGQVIQCFIPSPELEAQAVLSALSMSELSDDFILTPSNAFIVDDWDVSILRQRQRFAKRRGSPVDMMVETIRYLVSGGFPCFDYQLEVPMIVNKRMAREVLAIGVSHKCHFRTLYCNLYFNGGQRMDDPNIDLWLHSYDPKGPVVSVGPTALRAPRCRRWVNNLINGPV